MNTDVYLMLIMGFNLFIGFVAGYAYGFKAGVKDGYSRGKAAGMRTARDIMVKVRGSLDV